MRSTPLRCRPSVPLAVALAFLLAQATAGAAGASRTDTFTGRGLLHENSTWLPTFQKMPEDRRQLWGANFDPSRWLHSPDYFAQPGLGREGALRPVEQGVRVIGIDAYTLDRPFASRVADYRRTGEERHIWPAHFAGSERDYCQIEKLANLDRLPRPHCLYASCLPVKIQGARAGGCRAVALVPEGD